jgi:peptidoglycan/xylan/chitin deacetylase (PgdA/CDA1 family)
MLILNGACGGLRSVSPASVGATATPPCLTSASAQSLLRIAYVPDTAYPPGPLAPVVHRVNTTRRVVFITIDDGWTRDPAFPAKLAKADVPTSLFLIAQAAKQDYRYFKQLRHQGAVIEDHSIDHPVCTRLSYADQRHQICDTAATYRRVFGHRPTLFRPPYGELNTATQRAAEVCGMDAVVHWDVTVNSGRLAFAIGDRLRRGDIILMHFTSHVRRDFAAALAAARAQHLKIGRLENYL